MAPENPWDPDSLARLASLRRGDARFPTTRWSLVLDAAGERDAALEALFAVYWPPVYAFARRSGDPPEVAADLVQELFTSLLERRDLAAADPGRGRFRSWLLGALKHLRANRVAKEKAAKRGGGALPVPLEDAEQVYALASPDVDAEALYQRLWAARVLETARERVLDGARPLIRELAPLLEDHPTPPYAELAERHGTTEGAVKVAAHRLKKRFEAALIEVLRDTVRTDERVEREKIDLGL